MRRIDLSFEVTTKDMNEMTRRAREMGLSLRQLVLFSLVTGIESVVGIDMLNRTPLEAMADDLETPDEGSDEG